MKERVDALTNSMDEPSFIPPMPTVNAFATSLTKSFTTPCTKPFSTSRHRQKPNPFYTHRTNRRPIAERHSTNRSTNPKSSADPPSQSSRVDPHAPENHGFLHVATITSPHGVKGEVKATATTDFPAHRLSATTDIPRFLLLPGRRYPRPVQLGAARPASRPGVWILKFDGVSSREDVSANRLQNARLYVRQEDKPPLARGEYVAADLVNLRVALRRQNNDDNDNDNDNTAFYIADTKRGGRIAADAPVGIVEEVITAQELCRASGGGASAAKVANDLLQIAVFEHDDFSKPVAFLHDVPDTASRVLVPFVKQIVPVVDLSVALLVLDPPPGLLSITVVNKADKPRPPRALLMPAAQ